MITLRLKAFNGMIKELSRIAPISREQEQQLKESFDEIEFKKQTEFQTVGDKRHFCYYVAGGYAAGHIITRNGKRIRNKLFGKGSFIGDPNFFTGENCEMGLVSSRNLEIFKFSRSAMLGLEAAYPQIKQITAIATGKSLHKHSITRLSYLALKGEDRVLQFYINHPRLLPFPKVLYDEYLAEYLDMTPTTLRTLRRELIRKKLLTSQKL